MIPQVANTYVLNTSPTQDMCWPEKWFRKISTQVEVQHIPPCIFSKKKIFLEINNIVSCIYLSISIETHNLITAIMFYKRSINSLSGRR